MRLTLHNLRGLRVGGLFPLIPTLLFLAVAKIIFFSWKIWKPYTSLISLNYLEEDEVCLIIPFAVAPVAASC